LSKLVTHITHCKLALLQVFNQLCLLLGSKSLLHFGHEAFKISETKQTFDETGSFELFEVVEVLSSSDINNGTLGGSNCRKGSTSLGMSIKLGDDNLTYSDGVVESLCLTVTGLSNASIHNEDGSVGLYSLLYLEHLIEK